MPTVFKKPIKALRRLRAAGDKSRPSILRGRNGQQVAEAGTRRSDCDVSANDDIAHPRYFISSSIVKASDNLMPVARARGIAVGRLLSERAKVPLHSEIGFVNGSRRCL